MSDEAAGLRRQLDEFNEMMANVRDGKAAKGGLDLFSQFLAAIGAIAISTATLVLDMDARLEKIETGGVGSASPDG